MKMWASWRRSHPTVIVGELLPALSTAASHARDIWPGEGQSLPFASSQTSPAPAKDKDGSKRWGNREGKDPLCGCVMGSGKNHHPYLTAWRGGKHCTDKAGRDLHLVLEGG